MRVELSGEGTRIQRGSNADLTRISRGSHAGFAWGSRGSHAGSAWGVTRDIWGYRGISWCRVGDIWGSRRDILGISRIYVLFKKRDHWQMRNRTRKLVGLHPCNSHYFPAPTVLFPSSYSTIVVGICVQPAGISWGCVGISWGPTRDLRGDLGDLTHIRFI